MTILPLRRTVLLFAASFAALATLNAADTSAPTASKISPAAKLGSAVFDWDKLSVKPTKVGERRDLFDAPAATLTNFECHITTIKPGESPHAPHRHPDEEIIVVKEGTLEVNINGQFQRAGAGSVFFFASNDLHGMRNVGTVPATYHVFRFITPLTPPAK